MSDDPKATLAAAELQSAEARARLSGTVADLQARLDPRILAQEAKDAGTAAALAGVDRARRHPGLVAGTLGALGLLAIGRQIAAVRRRRLRRRPVPAQPKSAPHSHSKD